MKCFNKFIPVFLVLLIFSCSDDIEILSIQRESLVSFNISTSQEIYRTKDSKIIQGQLELKQIPQSTSFVLFRRLTLVASGEGSGQIQEFHLSISFNTQDPDQMVGSYSYRPLVPEVGNSIVEAELLIRRGSTWTIYSKTFCDPERFPNFNLVVERQLTAERLVTGTFTGFMCNEEEIITINGSFKDLIID
ncbi:MAG: hypothetical protein N2044_12865 [Cyclobacteriaceae bacterium]|nr:hypothetical protein [Cyclobacteriaceae bacterium]